MPLPTPYALAAADIRLLPGRRWFAAVDADKRWENIIERLPNARRHHAYRHLPPPPFSFGSRLPSACHFILRAMPCRCCCRRHAMSAAAACHYRRHAAFIFACRFLQLTMLRRLRRRICRSLRRRRRLRHADVSLHCRYVVARCARGAARAMLRVIIALLLLRRCAALLPVIDHIVTIE